jgi:hypothetical protein
MEFLIAGVVILAGVLGGWRYCLPNASGQMKPFLREGRDTWIAVAITVGVALGFGALVVGVTSMMG